MIIYRNLFLRRNQVAAHDDSIFHKLEIEKARSHDISEQLSCHVSDVFQALGNHDVRFDFDPFSLDDCRCDFVNSREINVLCSLKHLPMESLVIEEDGVPGQVKLTLRDGFVDRLVFFEDFCTLFPETISLKHQPKTNLLSAMIRHLG